MNSFVSKGFKGFQFLNLDVVLGAVGWHLTFLRLPQGEPRPLALSTLSLGLCLWVIYTLDRILDTYRGQNSTERHRFHDQHQFNLSVAALAALSVAFCTVFFLPQDVIQLGIGLFLAVLLYFLLIHAWKKRSYTLKQGVIPVIYGSAVLGTAWAQLPVITSSMWVITLQWFLVLFQNMRLFKFFESEPALSPPRWIRWVAVGQLFTWIILFGGTASFAAYCSALLTAISLLYALLPTFPRIRPVFRGWVDGLLLAGWFSFLF